MCSAEGAALFNERRVSPFGYLRIIVCVPLPADFRSLPRPSSPVSAKASVVRPYTLAQSITLASRYTLQI